MPRWKMNGAGLAAWALLALSLLLAGCTVPEWQKPGTPRSEIERSMGRPTLSLPLDGGGTRLVYSRQPAGQQVSHLELPYPGKWHSPPGPCAHRPCRRGAPRDVHRRSVQ
jgi:hypothetical protein